MKISLNIIRKGEKEMFKLMIMQNSSRWSQSQRQSSCRWFSFGEKLHRKV